MLESIKKLNKSASNKYINSDMYWRKSPSNILLYKATKEALEKFAVNKVVLDAGAGRMAYKQLITSVAKKYISSDFQKTHPDLDVVIDIEKMSKKVQPVDVVFCSQVLEHVPHPWVAMKEISAVLKKNGTAIITVPHLAYLHNLPYDFFRYTDMGLRSLAKQAGLEVIKIEPLGGFFCFLGYIRSTALMPLLNFPVFGRIILQTNYLLSTIDIVLDKITHSAKLFPLNFIMLAKKK